MAMVQGVPLKSDQFFSCLEGIGTDEQGLEVLFRSISNSKEAEQFISAVENSKRAEGKSFDDLLIEEVSGRTLGRLQTILQTAFKGSDYYVGRAYGPLADLVADLKSNPQNSLNRLNNRFAEKAPELGLSLEEIQQITNPAVELVLLASRLVKEKRNEFETIAEQYAIGTGSFDQATTKEFVSAYHRVNLLVSILITKIKTNEEITPKQLTQLNRAMADVQREFDIFVGQEHAGRDQRISNMETAENTGYMVVGGSVAILTSGVILAEIGGAAVLTAAGGVTGAASQVGLGGVVLATVGGGTAGAVAESKTKVIVGTFLKNDEGVEIEHWKIPDRGSVVDSYGAALSLGVGQGLGLAGKSLAATALASKTTPLVRTGAYMGARVLANPVGRGVIMNEMVSVGNAGLAYGVYGETDFGWEDMAVAGISGYIGGRFEPLWASGIGMAHANELVFEMTREFLENVATEQLKYGRVTQETLIQSAGGALNELAGSGGKMFGSDHHPEIGSTPATPQPMALEPMVLVQSAEDLIASWDGNPAQYTGENVQKARRVLNADELACLSAVEARVTLTDPVYVKEVILPALRDSINTVYGIGVYNGFIELLCAIAEPLVQTDPDFTLDVLVPQLTSIFNYPTFDRRRFIEFLEKTGIYLAGVTPKLAEAKIVPLLADMLSIDYKTVPLAYSALVKIGSPSVGRLATFFENCSAYYKDELGILAAPLFVATLAHAGRRGQQARDALSIIGIKAVPLLSDPSLKQNPLQYVRSLFLLQRIALGQRKRSYILMKIFPPLLELAESTEPDIAKEALEALVINYHGLLNNCPADTQKQLISLATRLVTRDKRFVMDILVPDIISESVWQGYVAVNEPSIVLLKALWRELWTAGEAEFITLQLMRFFKEKRDRKRIMYYLRDNQGNPVVLLPDIVVEALLTIDNESRRRALMTALFSIGDDDIQQLISFLSTDRRDAFIALLMADAVSILLTTDNQSARQKAIASLLRYRDNGIQPLTSLLKEETLNCTISRDILQALARKIPASDYLDYELLAELETKEQKEVARQIKETGLQPTPYLVAHYQPGIEVEWKAQIDRITGGEEKFDPANPLHAALMYTVFRKVINLCFKTEPKEYTYEIYRGVLESTPADYDNVDLTGNQQAKLVYTGYEALSAALGVGLTPDQMITFFSQFTGKTGLFPFETFKTLPAVLQSGLTLDQIKIFFGQIVEKAGQNGFRALQSLHALLFVVVTPDSFGAFTRTYLRFLDQLTNYNRSVVLRLLGGNSDLFKTLGPDHFPAHFEMYVTIFEREPKLGYSILEGLLKGTKQGLIPPDISAERESILDFIRHTRGFVPSFYKAYQEASDKEAFFAGIDAFRNKMLNGGLSHQEADDIIREKGLDYYMALICMVAPPSGSSFISNADRAKVVESMHTAGEVSSHVPEAIRGWRASATLKSGSWQIKPGESDSFLGDLAEIRAQVLAEATDEASPAKLKSLIEDYLKSDPAEKGDKKKQVLATLYALVGKDQALRGAIEHFTGEGYDTILFWEQMFRDPHAIRKILLGVISQIPESELKIKSARNVSVQGDGQGLVRSVMNIWNGDKDKAIKSTAIQRILAKIVVEDLQTKILPKLNEFDELKQLVQEMIESSLPITPEKLMDELLQEPTGLIAKGRESYKLIIDKEIILEFKAVKGSGHELHGMVEGVCTGDDDSQWADPDFFLVAMVDRQTDRIVGYADFKVVTDKGKKVLVMLGINPSSEFLLEVRDKDLYPAFIEQIKLMAPQGGFDSVVMPTNNGISSNRTGIVDEIKKAQYPTRTLDQPVHWTEGTHYDFTEVYVVWER